MSRKQSTGATTDARWQSFYAHVDTFLTKARSVPEIIESCFGADRVLMQTEWFRQLPVDEQTRRKKFSRRFRRARDKFSRHYLTQERHASERRLGFPNVEGQVIGPFGDVHTASPVKRVPTAESRRVGNSDNDPALQWAATQPPLPVQPRLDQFTIGGKLLFNRIDRVVERAQALGRDAKNFERPPSPPLPPKKVFEWELRHLSREGRLWASG
jgi:hypothetical protein